MGVTVSVLSDRDLIRTWPGCKPGPASVDLHLGGEMLTLERGVVLDPESDQSDQWSPLALRSDGRWMLDQGRPYLGVTAERVSVDDRHVAMLHGVSSIGRLFLLIHVTAGLVDPGWERGRLTLELFPLGAPVLLRPSMRIGQVTLHELSSQCLRPYGHAALSSKYQGNLLPTPSRSYRDWSAAE